LANHLDSFHTLIATNYYGSDHHSILQLLKERLASMLGIVLAHLFVCELTHFHATETESFLFKAFGNFAYQSALQA
jgi:hypothetical protein